MSQQNVVHHAGGIFQDVTLASSAPDCATGAPPRSAVINTIGARAHALAVPRERELARELVARLAGADVGTHGPIAPYSAEQAYEAARAIASSTAELDALACFVPFSQVINNMREFHVSPARRSRTPTSEFVASRVAVGPGDCLLDAGCSAGRYLLEHAGCGARLIGVDLTAFALEIGSSAWAATQPGPQPTWLAASILDLPLEPDTCTHVTSFVVLAYVPLRKALGEFHRVLKPGGKLVLTTEGPGYLGEEWRATPMLSSRKIGLARWWLGSQLMQQGFDWQGRPALGGLSSVTLYAPTTLGRILPQCGFTVEEITVLRTSAAGVRLIGVVARKTG